MALNDYKLTYTKDWKDSDDFPTVETDEAQVRYDIQLLFDEMRDAFNVFIDALNAGLIPFDPTAEIDSSTVQAAIVNVQSQIAAAVTGGIPDNSLTTAKYKDGSVTLAKLNSDVTPVGIGAAPSVHNHDDRYYTESEITNQQGTGLLDAKQVKTSQLPVLAAELADADAFPMYDTSEATANKLTWLTIKTLMKAFMDTAYATEIARISSHASRHAPDGADPLPDGIITADKIEDGSVSTTYTATILEKIDLNTSAWNYFGPPYIQEFEMTGMTTGTTATYGITGADPSQEVQDAFALLSFLEGDDKVTASSNELTTVDVPVTVTFGGTPHYIIVKKDTEELISWVPTGRPWRQDVEVEGLLATDEPFIGMVASDTYAEAEKQVESYAFIYKAVAEDDKLVFYAIDPTEIDIPIQIKVVRK